MFVVNWYAVGFMFLLSAVLAFFMMFMDAKKEPLRASRKNRLRVFYRNKKASKKAS